MDADNTGDNLQTARERQRPLRVVVSSAERAQIELRASACSLSVSAFLRTLGAGFEPKSTLDKQALGELVKVHADQGRLGGLLKLWLTEKPGQGASTYEVRRLLRQIEDLQGELKAIVGRLK